MQTRLTGERLPAGKGSYALLLRLNESDRIRIGGLGEWRFAAGYYLYLGSALGPGGLAARLRRHLLPEKRPFWHIDYLRGRATVAGVWYVEKPVRYEHTWAAAAGLLPGATIPVPRFGSSDCRCPAHLVYFQERPSISFCERAPANWEQTLPPAPPPPAAAAGVHHQLPVAARD
jgi:Uri superfamily endonuclease